MGRHYSTKELDDIAPKIANVLMDPDNTMSVKEIAGKFKVDVNLVRSIAKTRCKKTPGDIVTNFQTDEELNEINDETKFMTETYNKQERKQRVKVTDDIIIQVLIDLDEGLSRKEIAEKNGISSATLWRIIQKHANPEKGNSSKEEANSKQDEELEKSDKSEITDSTKLIIIKELNQGSPISKISKKYHINGNIIKEIAVEFGVDISDDSNIQLTEVLIGNPVIEAGLIRDRHDMPVDKFIFTEVDDGGLSEDLMFNYDELDNICRNFIMNEIGFVRDENGELKAKTDLVVYVTGLPCCVASIQKVCKEMHVNLTFMHHNFQTSRYNPQVIWEHYNTNSSVTIFDQWLREETMCIYITCH